MPELKLDDFHGIDEFYFVKIFCCYKKEHGYDYHQPFDYCPSCGEKLDIDKQESLINRR